MKLDMDKYLAAMTPPTLILNGKEYKGTAILKFADAVRFQKAWQDDPSGAGVLATAKSLCDAVGIPSEPVLDLPAGALLEVISGFFESANQRPEAVD